MTESPLDSPFESARPEETVPLLQSAVVRNSPIQCWSSGQKHSLTTRIVRVNEASGIVSISLSKEGAGGTEFEAALFREGMDELFFSLKLPTDVLFFKGELRKGDGSYITVRVKQPIFKVQRREAFRLPVSESSPTSVTVKLPSGEIFEGKVKNISGGGIALGLDDRAIFERLNQERPLLEISFTLQGISVVATAHIRHGSEVGSSLVKKYYRLGLEFATIDPKLKTRLSQMVLEESSKFIGRR